MTTIKFDKSVKYMGVRYAAHEAFTVNDQDVAELREAGATVLSSNVALPDSNKETEERTDDVESSNVEDVAQLKETLLEYSVSKLIKFAKEHNIDLKNKTRKADIYNVIVASFH